MAKARKIEAEKATRIMKQSIESCSTTFNGKAVVMFSGGRDSSAITAALCEAFPHSQVHLLFIDNGLLSKTGETRNQAMLLAKKFYKNEFIFETRRVSQMMRVVGMQQIEKDFNEHKFSTLLICVACKLIMNFSAARYAKRLGIKFILDGYANRQKDFPEQTDVFMDFVRDIFLKNNLTYLSPLYNFLTDKKQVNQTLYEFGIKIYKQEPTCMWAHSFSQAKDEEIIAYLRKTAKLIVEHDSVLKC